MQPVLRLAETLLQPVEVWLTGRIYLENQELRGLVAVQLVQSCFQSGKLLLASLDEQYRLR